MTRTRSLLALVVACLLALPAMAGAQVVNPGPPALATGVATNVDNTAARFNGTLDAQGVPTTYRFEYGTSTGYGLVTPEQVATGDSASAVEADVTGLTQNTTYHFRLVATNAAGTSRGADRTFRTTAPPTAPSAPTASSGGTSGTRTTATTLTASVNPRAQATTVRFEYGTSTGYGSRSSEVALPAGTSTRSVRIAIGGLSAYRRYQYRVVATNATGTTRGANRSFVTLRGPTSVSVSADEDKPRFGAGTRVSGRVRGSGIGGIDLRLQALQPGGGFREIGRTTASSSGSYAFTVGPLFATTRVRVRTNSTNVATSPSVDLLVRAAVGLRVKRDGARRAVFSGTVFPGVVGARVSVQRQSPRGRWVRARRTTVRAVSGRSDRGIYRLTVRRTRRAARWRVVVIPATGASIVRGVSRELRLGALSRRAR